MFRSFLDQFMESVESRIAGLVVDIQGYWGAIAKALLI